MRPLSPMVVRWPGGGFADSYDWHDGIGPRSQRPKRRNFWASNGRLRDLPESTVSKNDPNEFGTNEFMHFCRLIGAEPYVAANVRGMTARDFNEWIEYCNAPADASTAGAKRAADGDPEPFNVRFWASATKAGDAAAR